MYVYTSHTLHVYKPCVLCPNLSQRMYLTLPIHLSLSTKTSLEHALIYPIPDKEFPSCRTSLHLYMDFPKECSNLIFPRESIPLLPYMDIDHRLFLFIGEISIFHCPKILGFQFSYRFSPSKVWGVRGLVLL
jgi:hypothetical protein